MACSSLRRGNTHIKWRIRAYIRILCYLGGRRGERTACFRWHNLTCGIPIPWTLNPRRCRMWSGFVECIRRYTKDCATQEQRDRFNRAVGDSVDTVHAICSSEKYQKGIFSLWINQMPWDKKNVWNLRGDKKKHLMCNIFMYVFAFRVSWERFLLPESVSRQLWFSL